MEQSHQGGGGTGGVYERRDMSVRVIGAFLVGLAATVLLVFGLVWWMFDIMAASRAQQDVAPSPLAEAQRVPPALTLQVAPRQDVKAMRTQEEALLHSYGWMDQQAGVVRIPIDRAMKLLVERGMRRTSQKAGQ